MIIRKRSEGISLVRPDCPILEAIRGTIVAVDSLEDVMEATLTSEIIEGIDFVGISDGWINDNLIGVVRGDDNLEVIARSEGIRSSCEVTILKKRRLINHLEIQA